MTTHPQRWLTVLNTRSHRTALTEFLVIMPTHWAGHIAQPIQIRAVMGRPAISEAPHFAGA